MDGTQAAEEPPRVIFKKPSAKSKSSFRKRAPTPPPATSSDSDYSSSDDEEGRRIKRRRKNATVTASSASTSKGRAGGDLEGESGSTPLPLAPSNDATKQSNWYDEGKEDDLSSQNLLGKTRARAEATSTPDGTYKGAANYQSFIQKNPNATPKQVGPMKAPTNIRTITVTDYSPDSCKDYRLTG